MDGQDISPYVDAVVDRNKPLPERMRAVFYLRTAGSQEAVSALCKALEDTQGSTLFRHEVAFALGQIREPSAIPVLTKILENKDEDTIVRHEVRHSFAL